MGMDIGASQGGWDIGASQFTAAGITVPVMLYHYKQAGSLILPWMFFALSFLQF